MGDDDEDEGFEAFVWWCKSESFYDEHGRKPSSFHELESWYRQQEEKRIGPPALDRDRIN